MEERWKDQNVRKAFRQLRQETKWHSEWLYTRNTCLINYKEISSNNEKFSYLFMVNRCVSFGYLCTPQCILSRCVGVLQFIGHFITDWPDITCTLPFHITGRLSIGLSNFVNPSAKLFYDFANPILSINQSRYSSRLACRSSISFLSFFVEGLTITVK